MHSRLLPDVDMLHVHLVYGGVDDHGARVDDLHVKLTRPKLSPLLDLPKFAAAEHALHDDQAVDGRLRIILSAFTSARF